VSAVSQLLPWADQLLGLETARCEEAEAVLRSWRLAHVEAELLDDPDLDTLVAALLLVESVDALVAQGVQRTKLLKKLRDAKSPDQFWPVWAEIRAAACLIGHPDVDVRIEMEAERVRGRHADFRLIYPDGGRVAVEFKALGLSDTELAWHKRAGEHFEDLLPPLGLSTVHGFLDRPIRISSARRARGFKNSAILSRRLKQHSRGWASVRGVAIVARQTEQEYLLRARARIEYALGQLNTAEECAVAFWWSNGSPLGATSGLLDAVHAPPNITGLAFIGQAVAVPWSNISIFMTWVDREANTAEVEINSGVDDRLAGLFLDRFESSSGLRPTLVRAPGRDGITLLRRDGRRRILPFNLLFDADPRKLASPFRPPSPVQNVYLDE